MRKLFIALLCAGVGLTMAAGEPSGNEAPGAHPSALSTSSRVFHRHLQQRRAAKQPDAASLSAMLQYGKSSTRIAVADQYALMINDDGTYSLDSSYSDGGAYMGLRSWNISLGAMNSSGRVKINSFLNSVDPPQLSMTMNQSDGTVTIKSGRFCQLMKKLPNSQQIITTWFVYPESYMLDPSAELEDIHGWYDPSDGSVFFEDGFFLVKQEYKTSLINPWFGAGSDGGGDQATLGLTAADMSKDTLCEGSCYWSPLMRNVSMLAPNGTHAYHKVDILAEGGADTPSDSTSGGGLTHIHFDPSEYSGYIFIDFSDPGNTALPDNWGGRNPVKRPPISFNDPILDDGGPGSLNPGNGWSPSGFTDALNEYVDPQVFKSPGASQLGTNGGSAHKGGSLVNPVNVDSIWNKKEGGHSLEPLNWGGRQRPPVRPPQGLETAMSDFLRNALSPDTELAGAWAREPAEVPVYIWQNEDTVHVINLYATGASVQGTLVSMTVNAAGTVTFPWQDVLHDGNGNVVRNYDCVKDSVDHSVTVTPGNQGTVTPNKLTWGDTALLTDATSAPGCALADNELYFNDENGCFDVGARVSVTDVTTAINRVLDGDPDVDITTVTRMINQALNTK